MATQPNPVTEEAKLSDHFSYDEIFEMVQRPLSSFNWMLVRADPSKLSVYDAGGGGLASLQAALNEKSFLYGYMRLGFGSGPLRRTKWVFLRWSGENTPPLERGRGAEAEEAMMLVLAPHAMEISATAVDEMCLEDVIQRVTDVIASDDSDAYSIAKYEEALAEEMSLVGERKSVLEIKQEIKDEPLADVVAVDGVPVASSSESESEDSDSDDHDDDDDQPFFMDHLRVRPHAESEDPVEDAKVIIDIGYGNTRFGLAGEDKPGCMKNLVWNEENKDYVPMIERKKMESMACDWNAVTDTLFGI